MTTAEQTKAALDQTRRPKAAIKPPKAAQGRTKATAKEPKAARRRQGPPPPAAEPRTERTATLPIPVVTPHLKVYRVHLPAPDVHGVVEAGRSAASHLPAPGQLAFAGGLAGAAVLGVLDWPVAAAVGIGTVVARRARGRRSEAERADAS